jgi:phage major head subunit gpT-like protein
MLITPENIAALTRTYNTAWTAALAAGESDLAALKGVLFTEYPSSGSANVYAFLSRMSRWREWLGARVWGNIKADAFVVPNRKFEDSVEVDRDAIEDDSYGMFTALITQMGAGWYTLQRELLASVLLTPPVCFTGKALLAEDHAYGANALDNLTADALSVASFEAALEAASAWKFANGDLCKPNFTHLVVGEQLRTTAFNIVKNSRVADAVATAAALDNPNQGRVDLLVMPEITGTQWYLVASSLQGAAGSRMGMRPLGLQVRRAPVPTTNDARDVELTGNYRYFASGRCEAFGAFPHLVYGKVTA